MPTSFLRLLARDIGRNTGITRRPTSARFLRRNGDNLPFELNMAEPEPHISTAAMTSMRPFPIEREEDILADIRHRRRFEQLHSDEGLPWEEWNVLSEKEKDKLLYFHEKIEEIPLYIDGVKREPSDRRVKAISRGRGYPFTREAIKGTLAEDILFAGPEAMPEPYRKFEETVVGAVKAPIFEIAGVPISTSDLAAVGLLAYGGYQAVSQGLKVAYNSLMRSSINKNLNSWAKGRGITIPQDTRSLTVEYLARNVKPTWANFKSALRSYFKPIKGGTFEATAKAQQAADATTRDIVQRISPHLEKFTSTRTGVPGQATSQAEIIAALSGVVPETARVTQAGRMELKPEAKEPWQMTRDEFVKIYPFKPGVEAVHHAAVFGAINQGKPVPQEVLKDYPDLQVKVTKPAPELGEVKLPAKTRQLSEAEQFIRDELFNEGMINEAITRGKQIPFVNYDGKLVWGKAVEQGVSPELYDNGVRIIIEGKETIIEASGLIVSIEEQYQARLEQALTEALISVYPGADITKSEKIAQRSLNHLENIVRQVKEDAGIELSPDWSRFRYPTDAINQVRESVNRGLSVQPEAPKPAPELGEARLPEKAITEPLTEPPKPPTISIPPTEPPKPPEIVYSASQPVPDARGRISFAPLQNAQNVVDIATRPDVYRWASNLPIAREIMSKVSPSAVANTPAERAIIVRAVLWDEASQKSQGILAYRNAVGSEEKIFGRDKDGFIAKGKQKGLTLGDIIENPSKIRGELTAKEKEFIKRFNEINRGALQYAKDNDINIKELTFEEGGEWAGRRVFVKYSSDGEVLETAFIGAGPGRVGGKLSFEKTRYFDTQEEAINEGYRYIATSEVQDLSVRGLINKVADKNMSEWLFSQVPWRTTGAPDELILAAESARMRLNRSKQLLAALNRANRGEKVPTQTINSIAKIYPDEASELQSIIDSKQAGQKVTKEVSDLRRKAKAIIASNSNEYNAAVNARARAREKAMTPAYGESMLMHPAFQGKIFTGPEAKKTAETLRNALEPRLSNALESANKLNALVRYFKLAGDVSPLGIQLLFLAGQNPLIYGQSGAAFAISMFDKEFHAKYLSKNKEVIDRHPNLLLSSQGTEFTEAMHKGGLLRKGPLKIGGKLLGPFQMGFETSMDVAGIEMAKGMEHLAKTPQQLADLDQFINEFRGMTSSARLGVSPNMRGLENLALLAPRYNRAIAGLLFDAGKGFLFHGGLRGRLARNGLIRGIIAVMASFIAIGFALGKDWDEITESLKPQNSNFMTYSIGGTNIGPGSKVRSVIKLIAESIENPDDIFEMGMENPLLRFARGNLSPITGESIDIISGRNYIGDPTRDNWLSFMREGVITNFLPIWVENVIMEGGTPSERMTRGAGEFFGGRAYPETTWQEVSRLRDRYAAEDYGLKYDELNNEQKGDLRRNHDDLSETERRAEEESAAKGSDVERFLINERNRIVEERNSALSKAAQAYLDGDITKYEYDKERSRIRPFYSGGRDVLWSAKETLDEKSVNQIEKWLEDNQKPEDRALSEYWEYYSELIELADLPVDWDSIELQMEEFKSKYTDDIQEYINENLNSWIKDLPEPARQVEMERLRGIEDESWWDNYRGTSMPTGYRSRKTETPSRTYIAPFLNEGRYRKKYNAPFLP